jgi:hypothetical protein
MRKGEDYVHVACGHEFLLARLEPAVAGLGLTLGTVPRHPIHGRWFDSAIRLRGSFLTRRIERDRASYTRAHHKFDQVCAGLTTELDKLVEKARKRLREFGLELEDSRARAEACFEDMFRQFESTYDQLNLKLVPYGQALREMTSKKLEKYLRAYATEPWERKSLNLADAPDTLYP